MCLLPPLGGGWGHKTRSKPQLPPEFHANQELTTPDESATLMDVKQMLGTLTTALAMITTQVEHLSQGKAPQVAPMSAQPGTRAVGNPPATSSASINLDMEQQVRNMVEHQVRTSHTPAMTITDDETDGE